MKKFRFNYLVFGLFSLSFLASCGGDSEEAANFQASIVGTWRYSDASFTIDGVSYRDYVVQFYRNLGIPLTDDELAELDESFTFDSEDFDESELLEFQSDGTLLITDNEDGTTERGTWVISEQILTIDDGDDVVQFLIKSLTDREMQLTLIYDEDVDLELFDGEDAVMEFLFTFTR